MYRNIFLTLLATLMLLHVIQVDGARILGLFSPPAPSHYFLGHKIMKELALRGHEVTLINSFGQKKPMKNYKDVVIKGFYEEMEEHKKVAMDTADQSFFATFTNFIQLTQWMAEKGLNAPEVIELLQSNQKFDLVIMETFQNEAHVGFAHHYDVPLVLLSTVGPNLMINYFTKNPEPISYCPQMMAGITGKMNFANRLKNTIATIFMEIMLQVVHYPAQNDLLHKYFPDAPHMSEIIRERTSIVLMNSHSSISPAKPLVPNMIEIGGFHVEEPKELPKDLKEYLDGAKKGFILFSMGSNLKSTMLPLEKRQTLMKVFEKIPCEILWKFEDDNMPGKPKNVKIDKWLPQNDILAHPNIKLFITHGGLLSTTEAIYHGVPVVGIPVIADQKMNMENAKQLGIGKSVDFDNLDYNELLNAIQTVLNDKSYSENAKERSKVMRDQPMKPIDTAMFWIEYALRNKYAKHLKTAAVDLEWWELKNLDVYAFLLSTILLVVYIFSKVSCWIIRKLCCSSKQKKNLADKKNQ